MTFADHALGIEPLARRHDRTAFSCGVPALDRYLREQATQDIRRGVASVFVAVEPVRPDIILGYFTLSAASIAAADLPADTARRLPRHAIPAALIGRLAVDRSVARRGLGAVLLADAIGKAVVAGETVAMSAVAVDPIDAAARGFYARFGFVSLGGPDRRMFLVLPRRTA